jgi:hypothetical protein
VGRGTSANTPPQKAQNEAQAPSTPDNRQLIELLSKFIRNLKRVSITINFYVDESTNTYIHQHGSHKKNIATVSNVNFGKGGVNNGE